MSDAVKVKLHPFTWDDLPTIVDIINRCDAVDGLERGTSESKLRDWWTRPHVNPEANGFIATVADKPAGYGLVGLRKGDERSGFSKFHAHGIVLPEYRRQGIGTRIMAECERRARARLDEAPTSTVYFNTWTDARLTGVVAMCTRLGMQPVRYFFEMVYDSPELPAAPLYPPGYGVRTFVRGQDEEITLRTFNTAFRDHWGHTESPLEEWLHWVNSEYFAPDLAYLGLDPTGKVAGLCLCKIYADENERVGREQGWVDELGVLREHRHIGLGRALLLEGMGALRRRGCTHILLDVDIKNPTGALRLYESVGFRAWKKAVTYRKTLRR
ncbi:MAG: GNAT family N-acetyltransferase [Chloroflexota bacterium]|nr:GNAT family N-acetyltransferase [Chloroflexota bacterium]